MPIDKGLMKDLDLTQALKTAKKAAQAGRKVLLHYFGQLKKVQEKAHAGLVSEADIESEKVITAILKADFPDIAVLGEEGAFAADDSTVKASSWVVDPLDGTTNYVHGFHIFNVSIGLQWQGELVAGVIDLPMLDRTYWATKGGGAFVNGERMQVSSRQTIQTALLATGFFPDNTNALKEQLKIFSELVYDARGIRRPGAAAYDLALVAEGVFDAFWEPNLKPWDAAAGVVLVREAGGVVWNYDGQPYALGHNTLISGNEPLARRLLERIKPLRNR
jgi:myo-inositol-1(or 4)-monophosphatase